MTSIHTPIIPIHQSFLGERQTLDLKAICVFAATGFFLDQDTFFKEQIVLAPAHDYETDENKTITKKTPWFQWHYSPRDISFEQAVNEFTDLFETIVNEQAGTSTIILPLSGGLDSRTLAVALRHLEKKTNTYSYSLSGGHAESWYGKKIADRCGFRFNEWKVPNGYLWQHIEKLAQLNQCYSEFTHPRQMAFLNRYEALGDVFYLGHWGDVLFDDMGVPDHLSEGAQVESVLKKIVKKGGRDLARALWHAWSIEGNFDDYLHERVSSLLNRIDIPHSANAKIRAFKSLHWAPRWTSINLAIFESIKPIAVPYFDDRMCQFICTVPEKYLSDRQIQIAYIKKRNPQVAKIAWQDHRPFNLYTYKNDTVPINLPYRFYSKVKRMIQPKLIQRNWELQFLGEHNQENLRKYLFNNAFNRWVPDSLTKDFFLKFNTKEAVYFSHPVSMLLTLSLFAEINSHKF